MELVGSCVVRMKCLSARVCWKWVVEGNGETWRKCWIFELERKTCNFEVENCVW
jgi:hypothetical protein